MVTLANCGDIRSKFSFPINGWFILFPIVAQSRDKWWLHQKKRVCHYVLETCEPAKWTQLLPAFRNLLLNYGLEVSLLHIQALETRAKRFFFLVDLVGRYLRSEITCNCVIQFTWVVSDYTMRGMKMLSKALPPNNKQRWQNKDEDSYVVRSPVIVWYNLLGLSVITQCEAWKCCQKLCHPTTNKGDKTRMVTERELLQNFWAFIHIQI